MKSLRSEWRSGRRGWGDSKPLITTRRRLSIACPGLNFDAPGGRGASKFSFLKLISSDEDLIAKHSWGDGQDALVSGACGDLKDCVSCGRAIRV